eukprot:3878938-Pyramimonas_sp.AAC.1
MQEELACGSVYCHSWWPHNPWGSKKISQKRFEGLGGFQIRDGKWPGDNDGEKAVDINNISARCEFLRKMRPSSNKEGGSSRNGRTLGPKKQEAQSWIGQKQSAGRL